MKLKAIVILSFVALVVIGSSFAVAGKGGGCNLIEETGILTQDPDCGAIFYLTDGCDTYVLFFGPYNYLTETTAACDYDGDDCIELIIDELLGLEDCEITIKGQVQDDGSIKVVYINGDLYNSPGTNPWGGNHGGK